MYRWFENIKTFQQTIEIFHELSPRNVKGGTPPPSVHMTFLVDKKELKIYNANLQRGRHVKQVLF